MKTVDTDPPLVSVVVVTHKHRPYVGRCLEALARVRSEVPVEVMLVDNRSGDGTPELVRERFPWVRVSVRDRRRGFSNNNNFAIRQSTGRYVLLLNPDTEVRPGALRKLFDFMESHPDAGICGAKLLYPNGTVQPSCRRFPTLASVLVRRTPARWLLRDSPANARHLMLDRISTSSPSEVDWLLGACLFVRRRAIRDIGPLDDGYYLYVEDIDWCYRMRQGGWKVWWVPGAEIVHHHVAVSDRKLLSWHSWTHFWSMVRYFRKHLLPRFLRLKPEGQRNQRASSE